MPFGRPRVRDIACGLAGIVLMKSHQCLSAGRVSATSHGYEVPWMLIKRSPMPFGRPRVRDKKAKRLRRATYTSVTNAFRQAACPRPHGVGNPGRVHREVTNAFRQAAC